MAKATNGIITIRIFLKDSEGLKLLIEAVQRPIIILPQNRDMYFEISEASNFSVCLRYSPKFEPIVTSTPTYTKMAVIPKMACG